MGLFQRPSSQRAQPLSERRHLHNHVNNDHDSRSSKKPPAGTKRRGLLGGLIRGKKEVPLSRQGPPPPSPPPPPQPTMMKARSPTQIQSVPLPSPIQQELRQKLHEAQQVEAFLTQTGKFKPTIGGSDIEFLFNHIATPTAAQGTATSSSKSERADVMINNEKRRIAREKAGNLIGQVDAMLGSNNSVVTAQSVQAAYGLTNPQSPHLQQQLFKQQQLQLQMQRDNDTASNAQMYQQQPTTPQHVSNTDPRAAASVNFSDTSTKRSKKGKDKKKGKRGLFSKKEKEWGAFESEQTYYQGMQALEEGRQFQKVSSAFIQHFNGQDSSNKSQSSKTDDNNNNNKTGGGTKKSKKLLGRKGRQKENVDDGTIQTNEKSMASTYQSSVTGSKAPLKGILRTNGKFGGSVSVKSGTGTIAEEEEDEQGGTIAAEGGGNGDDKSEAGGYDIYKSSSTDDMFVGIRPSDDSESTELYTDENELIELRSALASTSDEASEDDPITEDANVPDQAYNMEPSTPPEEHHDRKDDHRILKTDGSSHYQQALSSPPTVPEQPKQSVSAKQSPPQERSRESITLPKQSLQKAPKGDPPIGPGRKGDPSPTMSKESLSTQEIDLKESESSNGESYKSIQDRFADMLQSVGTFHETQNQKIEEVKQSFISALTATPVAKNTSSSPTQEFTNNTPLHGNTSQHKAHLSGGGLHHSLACGTPSAAESFATEDDVSKQDELYRQLMNAPSGEHVEAAVNLIRERSNGNLPSTNHGSAAKAVEHVEADRTVQREETQRPLSQPQLMTGAAAPSNGNVLYEDDPSLAEVLNLNPSTSSVDDHESIRNYWEMIKQKEAQKTRELVARTEIGTSFTRQQQRQELTNSNIPKYSPHISTEPANGNGFFHEPPAIGRGSSIAENTQGDGMMFSIESEDESLLQDSLLQEHAPRSFQRATGSRLYDRPIPSAKSSFSMARSRQLSLVDSASTDEDMSVAAYNKDVRADKNPRQDRKQENQIDHLLDRLESVEKRKYTNAYDEQDFREDQTIEDEISDIKSILQGLKMQNENQRKSYQEEEESEANQVQQTHSSGESTTSTYYVKTQLLSPEGPADRRSEMFTPKSSGGESMPRRAPRYPMTTPRKYMNYNGDVDGNNYPVQREYQTEPQRRSQPADYMRPEPQQLFVDEPYEQGLEWPADDHVYNEPEYNYDENIYYDGPIGNGHEYRDENSHISYYGHDVHPDEQYHPEEDARSTRSRSHYHHDPREPHSNYYNEQMMESQGQVVYSAPAHPNEAAVLPQQQSEDEFFYSRTESDITTSIAFDASITKQEANAGAKSNRAASYFDTLSAGVKAVGSFDSVSDRNSLSTSSKKTSSSSTGNTKNSRGSTIGTGANPRHTHDPNKDQVKFKDESKKSEPAGFSDRIFRNAKDHIEKMEQNGDISERNKTRVLRFMNPLVGNSSDDESTLRSHSHEEDDEPRTLKSYLPACHFFCG